MRLRPSSQGSIIGSYYKHGLDRAERPADDARTWELSHYYARGGARGEAGSRSRAQMRLAVLAAAVEAGVDRIISVCETPFWPAAERCGWSARRLGPTFAYCDGGEALVYEIDSSPAALDAFKTWLDTDKGAAEVATEAGEVAAVAGRLGLDGLDIVSSLTRRIAEVEETDGADAAMALAEKLNRAASERDADS